ncbi:hypothetical protein LWC34_02955 [Kibdelosporangium philippinense]|uniref:Uncharacterized protein n=1 Tax=Kibdelosporangium philippinense TaxID=211113 RepID=A0ABS8Z1I8_9PSEU|nr:hypothetical protein [Kibdelosporangium philippinense]MCE7001804.1 hypothetical protein [Kibdelosporangium philippinense]
MPRIRLTYWWDGHAPGAVVDVDDQVATTLIGRIAVPATDDAETERPARKQSETSKA